MINVKWHKKVLFRLVATVSVVFSTCTFATVQQTVTLVAGLIKPPFIIEENGRGLQLDIIREALILSDIKVDFVHVPTARHIPSYQKLNFDGIITMQASQDIENINFSAPYIDYENVALTLSKNNFIIDDVIDLGFRNVAAFQNAYQFLGTDYQFAVSQAKRYQEYADQFKQIRSLFTNQSDVVIADVNIYSYFRKTHRDGIFNQAVMVHHVFEVRGYVAGFRDKKIRDKFTWGLKQLKSSGKYLSILSRYQEEHELLSKHR